MENGALEFIKFLQLFLEKYPEYKKSKGNRKFLLTGESYGGKYIPLFSKHIDDYAKNGKLDLDLMAVLIGNPIAAPILERTTVYKIA